MSKIVHIVRNVRTPGTYPEDSRRDYPARGENFIPEWKLTKDYYESRYYDDPRGIGIIEMILMNKIQRPEDLQNKGDEKESVKISV